MTGLRERVNSIYFLLCRFFLLTVQLNYAILIAIGKALTMLVIPAMLPPRINWLITSVSFDGREYFSRWGTWMPRSADAMQFDSKESAENNRLRMEAFYASRGEHRHSFRLIEERNV